jgi:hypothetical protein
MQWFKHHADARHDPFIWDLRRCFGGEGYFIYFGTLEIYADSFKPAAGWFLDVSLNYLKHELGIYHAKRLLSVIDFIRLWPNVGTAAQGAPAETPEAISAAAPKWIAKLTRDRIALLIPAFAQIMDNYTKQRLRSADDNGAKPPAGAHEVAPALSALFRDIARDCETLAGMPAKNGRPFPAAHFVGHCVKESHHPGAIRDAVAALVHNGDHWQDIKDPWAYARGVLKTRAEYYQQDPVDAAYIKQIYGGFFAAT